jgi:plastocyanin
MIASLLLLVAAPAFAARLHGTVRLPGAVHDDPSFHAYAGQASSMAEHMRTERGALTDAVLYVESVSASVDSGLPLAAIHPRLAQKDQSFQPRVVVVPVGGTVDFPNLDAIYHNVFSVSPIKRFDLGKYPRGESKSVRFPKAGLVNVYCDIHSDMAGFVLVTPNRAFARARADGTWQLPDLPPGHYVLCWWHPDFPAGKREVDLGASDTNVDVEF